MPAAAIGGIEIVVARVERRRDQVGALLGAIVHQPSLAQSRAVEAAERDARRMLPLLQTVKRGLRPVAASSESGEGQGERIA